MDFSELLENHALTAIFGALALIVSYTLFFSKSKEDEPRQPIPEKNSKKTKKKKAEPKNKKTKKIEPTQPEPVIEKQVVEEKVEKPTTKKAKKAKSTPAKQPEALPPKPKEAKQDKKKSTKAVKEKPKPVPVLDDDEWTSVDAPKSKKEKPAPASSPSSAEPQQKFTEKSNKSKSGDGKKSAAPKKAKESKGVQLLPELQAQQAKIQALIDEHTRKEALKNQTHQKTIVVTSNQPVVDEWQPIVMKKTMRTVKPVEVVEAVEEEVKQEYRRTQKQSVWEYSYDTAAWSGDGVVSPVKESTQGAAIIATDW